MPLKTLQKRSRADTGMPATESQEQQATGPTEEELRAFRDACEARPVYSCWRGTDIGNMPITADLMDSERVAIPSLEWATDLPKPSEDQIQMAKKAEKLNGKHGVMSSTEAAAWKEYITEAINKGMTEHQLKNYLEAKIKLSPTQLKFAVAARSCDFPGGPEEIGFGGARMGGKALALTTPLPTPSGWTTMGEIKIGDHLFDEKGIPCKVISTSEIMCGHRIYDVSFNDGSVIRADGGHLWFTTTHKERRQLIRRSDEWRLRRRANRPSRGTGKKPWLADRNTALAAPTQPPPLPGGIRTTEEIMDTLFTDSSKETNHCVAVTKPLQIPDADLLIDPYVLGVWLGDGGNKHIPCVYLRASFTQRLALAQGLMDTDGTVSKNGCCIFDNTNKTLIDGMYELLCSLGIRCVVRSGRAMLKGMDCGPKYRIKFLSNLPMFRFGRKATKQTFSDGKRHGRRFIVSVKQVRSEPVKCIVVDSPSRLFLAGKAMIPTHNSFAMLSQIGADDCIRYPGLKSLMLRQVGSSQKESFEALLPRTIGSLGTYVPTRSLFRMPNGSWIKLGHFQNESDIDSYLGLEYDVIGIEEATTLTHSKKIAIRSCCRSPEGSGFRARMYLTTNPGGRGHCVPFGDVLTPRGWRPIQEMAIGDPVYTVSPGGELVETAVSQIHSENYHGPMVRVVAGGLKMNCTPNHSVAKTGGVRFGRCTRDKKTSLYSLVPINKLPGQATIFRSVNWSGVPIDEFTVPEIEPGLGERPGAWNKSPVTLSGTKYATLMGWFLSEGHTVDRDRAFGISQMKESQRIKIKSFLEECGFNAKWGRTGAVIYSREWWSYLRQFGKCRDKWVPDQIKASGTEQLSAFFEAFVDGDGMWIKYRKSGRAYTTSRRLADDISEIALKLGYMVYVSERHRENRDGPSFEVQFRRTKTRGTEILTGHHVYDVNTSVAKESNVDTYNYDGMVYCLGIAGTHSFVIRQNGSVWVSGNSWFKQEFIRPFRNGQESLRRFIPSTVFDNPYAGETYIRFLESLQGYQRAAWLYGDWDIAQGLFFVNFRYDLHVIRDLAPPAETEFWCGFDYGKTHYTCCHLFTRTKDRDIYVLDEYAERQKTIPVNAEGIKGMLARNGLTPGQIQGFYAGKDCFDVRPSTTVASDYQACGIDLKRADTDRVSGASAFLNRLGDPDNISIHHPTIFFHPRCSRLIDCLTYLLHDDKNPDDVQGVDPDEEGRGGDDAYDSARYGVMAEIKLTSYVSYEPILGDWRG